MKRVLFLLTLLISLACSIAVWAEEFYTTSIVGSGLSLWNIADAQNEHFEIDNKAVARIAYNGNVEFVGPGFVTVKHNYYYQNRYWSNVSKYKIVYDYELSEEERNEFYHVAVPITLDSVKKRQYEEEVVRLVNIERAKVGARPLRISEKLQGYCAIRAKELIKRYSHTRPDGTPFYTVANDSKAMYLLGENAAASPSTPQKAVSAWMNSSGHRENILNPDYTEIGVGVESVKGSQYGYYWVQIFSKASIYSSGGSNSSSRVYHRKGMKNHTYVSNPKIMKKLLQNRFKK